MVVSGRMPAITIDFTDDEYARLLATATSPEGVSSFVRSHALAAVVAVPVGVEEWRSFREGEYDASSFGNVRRMTPGIATFVGRPLKPNNSSTGYTAVVLNMKSGALRLYTHRVVAEAFFGPCPVGMVVNHRDGNKKNNQLSNLEYITTKANVHHALKTLPRHRGPTKPVVPPKGRQVGDSHWSRRHPEKVARGEKNGSKMTEAMVLDIRARVAGGEMQMSLASYYKISVAQVSRIVRRLRWAHV